MRRVLSTSFRVREGSLKNGTFGGWSLCFGFLSLPANPASGSWIFKLRAEAVANEGLLLHRQPPLNALGWRRRLLRRRIGNLPAFQRRDFWIIIRQGRHVLRPVKLKEDALSRSR